MNKSNHYNMRLTPKEREMLEDLAQQEKRSKASVIRVLIEKAWLETHAS